MCIASSWSVWIKAADRQSSISEQYKGRVPSRQDNTHCIPEPAAFFIKLTKCMACHCLSTCCYMCKSLVIYKAITGQRGERESTPVFEHRPAVVLQKLTRPETVHCTLQNDFKPSLVHSDGPCQGTKLENHHIIKQLLVLDGLQYLLNSP